VIEGVNPICFDIFMFPTSLLLIYFLFGQSAVARVPMISSFRPECRGQSANYILSFFRPECLARVPLMSILPFSSESKTQYPFVLRGCVSSILYRSPILLARRLHFYSGHLVSGSRYVRDL